MASLNTVRAVNDLAGPSIQIYHQDLVKRDHQPYFRMDIKNLGNFNFANDAPPDALPFHKQEDDGLFFSIKRKANHTGAFGVHAEVDPQVINPALASFTIAASFRKPERDPLDVKNPFGTFASSVFLIVPALTQPLCGATVQFRLPDITIPGARLNLPGTNVNPNRPFSNDYYEEIVENQKTFTLLLHVKMLAPKSQGKARFYIENTLADSIDFTFENGLDQGSVISRFGAGLGTASGAYKASVKMTEFEIFVPLP